MRIALRGERRRYFRLDAQVAPQSIRRVDARGYTLDTLDAQLVEISGGGARLRITGSRLHPGHRLALCFALADELFELTGNIVWAEPVDEASAPGDTLTAGIRFDDADAGVRRRILASMNEHRRRHAAEAAGVVRRLR